MSEDNYLHYEEANRLLRSLWDDGREAGNGPGSEADTWRRLLIDMIYHFGHSITEERPEKGKNIDLHIEPLIRTLRALDRMPDHDRTILVRAKEMFFTGQRTAAKTDYIICFGNIVLDLRDAESMAERSGTAGARLRTRMSITFERLARYQIQSLYIEIPREIDGDIDLFRLSLRVLSAFHQALQSKVPVYFHEGRFDRQINIITDRNDQPNPNLTLLGALNHLKPELVKLFIQRFEDWTRRPRRYGLTHDITGMYGAMVALRGIMEKLRMPPFEINSTNRLALDRMRETLCPEQGRVIRLVEEMSGGLPMEGARLMEAIHGADYDRIDARTLAGRLLSISELMKDSGHEAFIEIRDNIDRRLGCVRDDVISRVQIVENGIRVGGSPGESGPGITRPIVEGPLCGALLELVRRQKSRSATREKIRKLAAGPVIFDEPDFLGMALEFGIDRADAERLLHHIGECFDANGRFQFDAFVKRIDAFAVYEKFAFVFFWDYIGDILVKDDRAAFLSALQHLVTRLGQSRSVALKLISDFCDNPDTVRLSDRNGLMLLSLLARTHNRELRIDTEVTPEEVLMTSEGLNPDLIDAVQRSIETGRKSVFRKVGTVDRVISDLLSERDPAPPLFPTLPFMLALQREVLICFGIIGGDTAFSIIRATAMELGDPDAAIHHLKKSQAVRPQLLSLLQTAIRALGREGRNTDVALLRRIYGHGAAFEAFNRADAKHVERVQRVMKWVEKLIAEMEGEAGEDQGQT